MTARWLQDSHGRVMRDLRVSLTDRCNFRCRYCVPETEEAANFHRTRYDARRSPKPAELTPIRDDWKPKAHLLTFEEIERFVRLAVGQGIEKIRVIDGKPQRRRDVPQLVAKLNAITGVNDLAMTTNDFLFARQAEALRAAGLRPLQPAPRDGRWQAADLPVQRRGTRPQAVAPWRGDGRGKWPGI